MSQFFQGLDPLSYMGVRAQNPPAVIVSHRAPAGTDKLFPLGTLWLDQTHGVIYSLLQVVNNAAVWTNLGGAGVDVSTLTGDNAVAISPTAGNINIVGGTGVSTVGSGSTITINVTGEGEKYSVVTADTPMVSNTGYITNKAGTAASMTLPAAAAVGDTVTVVGLGATGWVVAQGAGQTIHMNSVSTTTGAGGSLASTARYNTVTLVCTVANTDFTVLSNEGILTVT
jgi:hypothetical protein